jgi:citrate lyase subunit beta / citryl-CoA lyase
MKRRDLRSLLFVPADQPKKVEKGLASAADAVIMDLEDAVTEPNKARAREAVSAVLGQRAQAHAGPQIWVRVNAWDTAFTLHDLAACVRAGLSGIVLPKVVDAPDVERLAQVLEALEVRESLPAASVGVIPVITERAVAVLAAPAFARSHARVFGYIWGAEDLSADVGASQTHEADGQWSFVYRHARCQCLLAATAAGVVPIDTLFADYRDLAGMESACAASRRDGFRAKVAIHPDQVAAINSAFSPSDEDIAQAQAVIAAFAAQPGQGTVGLNGRMLDKPHLDRAHRLLRQAAAH